MQLTSMYVISRIVYVVQQRTQKCKKPGEMRPNYHALVDVVVCWLSVVGCRTEQQTGQLDNWQLVKCSTICWVDRQ